MLDLGDNDEAEILAHYAFVLNAEETLGMTGDEDEAAVLDLRSSENNIYREQN